MKYLLDIVGTILALGFFMGWKDKHWENVKAAFQDDKRPQPTQVTIRLVGKQPPKPTTPEELPANVITINRKKGYIRLPCSICGARPGEPCRPGCFVGIKQ